MEQITGSAFIDILLTIIGGLLIVLAFFLKSFINKLNKLDPERLDKMSGQLDKVYEVTIEQKYVNENYNRDIAKLKEDISTLNKRYNSIERKLESIDKKLDIPQN